MAGCLPRKAIITEWSQAKEEAMCAVDSING